ncbi:MAG: HlyC/CorC family transporter [Anaerolineae bacterium]|nr:HlyC/CorC family transporter [Anaerolineae bacterium]
MSAILLELVILSLLILLNGFFAMSELAVMSARKARLQEWAEQGNARARSALDLANTPNRFLSTVQIGITLVGVLAGAFGGATLSKVLGDRFAQVDALAPYADALGLGVVVAGITYFSLVIGELVPKRLALQSPERVASWVAGPMRALARGAAPVVRLLSASTGLVVRVLGIGASDEPPITEEEIRILIEQGTAAGIFRADEQNMVESVFKLDDRNASALMTPHTEIAWLDAADSPEGTCHKITTSGHTRFPVGRGSLDNLIGVVHANDLLARSLCGEPVNLDAVIRQPRIVPENAPASRVIQLLKRSQEHIVMVIDEHGGIAGLITEHDILQAIVGFIPTPDDIDPHVVQRADGSWLLDGLMHVQDVKELLGIDNLPGEAEGNYETLGGFVMSCLGQIPATGATFDCSGYRFEVVDMDGRRVDKILAARK